MNIDDVLKVAAAIITSIGGSAVIIVAVSKWCGEILAQKLLSDIDHKHEKDIEKYKFSLQNMSTEFATLLDHSVEVTKKQYDMEIEIYKKIWNALYDVYSCLSYIDDFVTPTGGNSEEYISRLVQHYSDFMQKADILKREIYSVAPFYKESVYDNLCKVKEKCFELVDILGESANVCGLSTDNANKINTAIKPEMERLKDDLVRDIRSYLLSLKKPPSQI